MSGLISVGVVFVVFAVGFFLEIRRLWPERTSTSLSAVVVRVAAPCLALTSITARFTKDMLVDSLILLLVALLHILALFLIGKLFSVMLKLGGGKKVVFEVTFNYSNIIFIGLPINQIVFGEEGTPFLFAYYIVILACFWGAGANQISAGAERLGLYTPVDSTGGGARRLLKILNPGFVCVLIGAFMVCVGLRLPAVPQLALGYLGDLTVPLSLLVIGANLTVFAKGIPRVTVDEVIILAGKFIISPLVMYALLKLCGISGLPFQVFMLSSVMPCHMQTSILAQHYNIEAAYAAKLVGLSTLFSIAVIPVFVAGIHSFT